MVEHFLATFNRELGTACKGVEEDALIALTKHAWKGNVRKLQNVLERAMILGDEEWIRMKDLSSDIVPAKPDSTNLRQVVRDCERRHIFQTLEKTGRDKTAASQKLGIGISSLYRKMKRLERRKGMRDTSKP